MSRTAWLSIVVIVAILSGLAGFYFGTMASNTITNPLLEDRPGSVRRDRESFAARDAPATFATGPPPSSPQKAPSEPVMSVAEGRNLLAGGLIVTMNPDGTKTTTPYIPFALLRSIYERSLSGEETDDHALMKLALHLGALETPEAIELLTRMIEDTRLDSGDFAHAFASALAEHVDDRVYRAALSRVEEVKKLDYLSPHAYVPYLELVARRRTEESAQIILSHLKSSSAKAVTFDSMRLVAHLDGFVTVDEIFEILEQEQYKSERSGYESHLARVAYDALASWQDPQTEDRLAQMAFENGHLGAYYALGRHVQPGAVASLLEAYYTREPVKERAVVEAISALQSNTAIDAEQRATLAGTILLDVLRNTEHPAWGTAASTVANDSAFHNDEFASLLRSILQGTTKDDQHQAVNRALRAIEKTLMKRSQGSGRRP